MFILGTSSVLGMVPNDEIDLIAPIPQLLSVGFGPLGAVAAIVPLTLSAMIAIRFAQASVNFAGSTRLPMVAGWDDLLPAWFTRLNAAVQDAGQFDPLRRRGDAAAQRARPDWRRQAGGVPAAVELRRDLLRADLSRDVRGAALRTAAGAVRPPWWMKLCALSGLLMTGLYVSLSVLPIIPVGSRTAFALKIVGLIVVTNLVGVALYVSGRRRARSQRAA